jgi:hypothetical protein
MNIQIKQWVASYHIIITSTHLTTEFQVIHDNQRIYILCARVLQKHAGRLYMKVKIRVSNDGTTIANLVLVQVIVNALKYGIFNASAM